MIFPQVRPPTFYQKCRDQQWFIHQLQVINAQQVAQISELKGLSSGGAGHVSVPSTACLTRDIPSHGDSGEAGPSAGIGVKAPLSHPHPHPLPRLKSRNRVAVAKSEAAVTLAPAGSGRPGDLECGPLSSSSDSEDGSSELDTADSQSRGSLGAEGEDEDAEENQPSIISDLDSLTEPSIETAAKTEATTATAAAAGGSSTAAVSPVLLEQLAVSLGSEVPCQESSRSLNTALEDELMLLRLLDLKGRSDRASSYGAASLDSSVNMTPRALDPPTPVPSSSARASSARNPIITADSIINTLQMEMATVGLTAAAISAASRYLDTTSEISVPRQAAERQLEAASGVTVSSSSGGHVIAPRPSLGRVEAVSSLPDNLASLLVSDQTSSAQFSRFISTSQ